MEYNDFLGYARKPQAEAVPMGLGQQPPPPNPAMRQGWQPGRNQQLIASLRARSMQNAQMLFGKSQQELGQLPAQAPQPVAQPVPVAASAQAAPLDPQFDPNYWKDWYANHY